MDLNSFFGAVHDVLSLVLGSSSTALLSAVGLILLLLTGVMGYIAVKSKPEELSAFVKVSLFCCLVGGMLFSAAGPALALFFVSHNPIQTKQVDQAFDDLINNARVNYLIRLIAYDPIRNPELGIDQLERLGPPKQVYSFVADYSELVGYTVKDALKKMGSSYKTGQHVSAIIFPLRAEQLYPANARGLLQVIDDVETRSTIDAKDKFFANAANALLSDELEDLKDLSIPSYRVEEFKSHYSRYCRLAHRFYCGNTTSRDLVGGLYPDWHPLGFSQKDPPPKPCSIPVKDFCAFSDWKQERSDLKGKFASRAFLIKNIEVKRIPGRILASFEDPERNVIPDIGAR